MKRAKKDRNGFTLVELIIILVILAILAALLVPALTGYINRAKKKNVLAECRMAVEAAQSISSEKYAFSVKKYVEKSENFKEIEKLAEVPGKILTITTASDGTTITKLRYENSGVIAVYSKNHNPQYYIEGEEGGTAEDDVSGLKGYAGYVSSSYTGTDRWDAAVKWMTGENIQELPTVSNELLKGSSLYNSKDPLYWRPYYIGGKTNGQVVYYANKNNMKDKDGNWLTSSGDTWTACVVMVNGKLYESPNGLKGTNIASWGAGTGPQDLNSLEDWLMADSNNFKQIE